MRINCASVSTTCQSAIMWHGEDTTPSTGNRMASVEQRGWRQKIMKKKKVLEGVACISEDADSEVHRVSESPRCDAGGAWNINTEETEN